MRTIKSKWIKDLDKLAKARHTPFQRFDYIRKVAIRVLAKEGKDSTHLSMEEVKKHLKKYGLNSKSGISRLKIFEIKNHEIYKTLADILGEDVSVLTHATEFQLDENNIIMPDDTNNKITKKADKQAAKIIEKCISEKRPSTNTKLQGIELVLENMTEFHLSILTDGNKIQIFINEDAPKATTVLTASQTVAVGGKNEKRTFPERIKI